MITVLKQLTRRIYLLKTKLSCINIVRFELAEFAQLFYLLILVVKQAC